MFVSIKKADGLRLGLPAMSILGVLSFDDEALSQLNAPTRPIGARAILFHSNNENEGVMVTWIDDNAFDVYQKVKACRRWLLLTGQHGGQSLIRPERVVDLQERRLGDDKDSPVVVDVTFTDGGAGFLATRRASVIEAYNDIMNQITDDQPPELMPEPIALEPKESTNGNANRKRPRKT